MDKPRRGRPPKPGGRGDGDRRVVGVSCSPGELAAIDADRGELSRAEYVRRHGVPAVQVE